MEEIKYEFECKKEIERIKHYNDLETQRIKEAGIKRTLGR